MFQTPKFVTLQCQYIAGFLVNLGVKTCKFASLKLENSEFKAQKFDMNAHYASVHSLHLKDKYFRTSEMDSLQRG